MLGPSFVKMPLEKKPGNRRSNDLPQENWDKTRNIDPNTANLHGSARDAL
jgi:hypothetical protein